MTDGPMIVETFLKKFYRLLRHEKNNIKLIISHNVMIHETDFIFYCFYIV